MSLFIMPHSEFKYRWILFFCWCRVVSTYQTRNFSKYLFVWFFFSGKFLSIFAFLNKLNYHKLVGKIIFKFKKKEEKTFVKRMENKTEKCKHNTYLIVLINSILFLFSLEFKMKFLFCLSFVRYIRFFCLSSVIHLCLVLSIWEGSSLSRTSIWNVLLYYVMCLRIFICLIYGSVAVALVYIFWLNTKETECRKA